MRPILRVALPAALLAVAAIGCVHRGVPLIVKHPESVFADEGQTVTFEAEATGSDPGDPFTYQWRRSDDAGATFDDLPGATSDPLELPAVTLADHDAQVAVRASAHFARVAGCTQTDDAIFVMVMAYDGTPSDFGSRWTNGIVAAADQGRSRDDADMGGVDGWLVHRTLRIDDRPPPDRRRLADSTGHQRWLRETALCGRGPWTGPDGGGYVRGGSLR